MSVPEKTVFGRFKIRTRRTYQKKTHAPTTGAIAAVHSIHGGLFHNRSLLSYAYLGGMLNKI